MKDKTVGWRTLSCTQREFMSVFLPDRLSCRHYKDKRIIVTSLHHMHGFCLLNAVHIHRSPIPSGSKNIIAFQNVYMRILKLHRAWNQGRVLKARWVLPPW
jgi:hypothetical protein